MGAAMVEASTHQGAAAYGRQPFFCDTMLDAFETELERATTVDRLCLVLTRNLGNLGFNHFAYLRFSEAGDGSPVAHVLTQYPTAWRRRYVAAEHVRADPALWRCVSRVTPVAWHELADAESTSEWGGAVLEEARGYGLRDGVATPLRSAHGAFAVLNAATDLHAGQSVELIRLYRNVVHMMSVLFHAHAERCIRTRALTLPLAHVSAYMVRKMLTQSL